MERDRRRCDGGLRVRKSTTGYSWVVRPSGTHICKWQTHDVHSASDQREKNIERDRGKGALVAQTGRFSNLAAVYCLHTTFADLLLL